MRSFYLESELGRTELLEGIHISIGKAGHDNQIEISDNTVSRKHCQVKLENGNVFVKDLGSTNGTIIQSKKISPNEWVDLKANDSFDVRGTVFHLRILDSPLSSKEPIIDVAQKEKTAIEEDRAHPLTFKDLIRKKGRVTVGRFDGNDIILNDPTVTRVNHATFIFENGEYFVEDLNSTNGTYLNGTRISKKTKLNTTDRVLISFFSFSLAYGFENLKETKSAVSAIQIKKVYGNGFVGLQPLSIDIPRGKFVALMGPSGCGKSTLLKCLNGDNPATSGNVFIHGIPLYSQFNFLKKKIGYVPQDDIVHRELTVHQTLFYAAKLRLPDNTSDEHINLKIDKILNDLNLDQVEKIKNSKVGELSGGQRKRVSIAVELLNDPTVLFLDEPTSPLDPETIESFLVSLKRLSEQGTTIVMVTHKPEDLNYVDNVIFMMVNGYIAYEGPAASLLDRFDTDKIVKVYSTVSDKKNLPTLIDKYYIDPKSQGFVNNEPQELKNDPQKSLLSQLYWLVARYFQVKLSDRYNLTLLLAQPFIIAGLIATIFNEFRVGVLFLMAISAIWFGVSNSAKEIVGELAIYRRERMFNLNINTYILSKWAVLSTIALFQTMIFVSIIYLRFLLSPLEGLEDIYLKSFGGSILFLFYISISSTLIGLALSAYFDNTEKVMTVVPIALMPQIMLAGVITKIDNLLKEVISFTMLGRWGTEGLSRIQDNSSKSVEEGVETVKSVIEFIPNGPEMRIDSLGNLVPIAHKSTWVPEGTSALKVLDFYNEELVESGDLIGKTFDSLGGNLTVILLLNVGLYVLIFHFLKRKTAL